MAWPGQHLAKACEAKTSLVSQGQEHVPCCQNCAPKGAYTLQLHNPKNPSAPLFTLRAGVTEFYEFKIAARLRVL